MPAKPPSRCVKLIVPPLMAVTSLQVRHTTRADPARSENKTWRNHWILVFENLRQTITLQLRHRNRLI